MPLDALCLSGLVHELDQTVTGGKIDKIYQPGRDEILLAVRTPAHGNVRLLLSARGCRRLLIRRTGRKTGRI